MFYEEYTPPAALQKYIKCFWTLEHDYTEKFHSYEHLWANTHTELIFSFGAPYYLKHNGKQCDLPKNFAIFPFKRELFLYSDAFTGLFAIRFHPWTAHKFINKPIRNFIDKIVNATELLGGDAIILNHQLNDKTREEKLKILVEYFLQTAVKFKEKEIETFSIAQEIIHRKGIVSIKELSEKFKTNPRKIERDFLQEIGISAKLYSRVVRFSNAREFLVKNVKASLAVVGYEVGYSDQAHFSKDFKEFFGITPAIFKQQLIDFYKFTAHH